MKLTMKKLMILALALVTVLSLCACGGNERDDEEDEEDGPRRENTFQSDFFGAEEPVGTTVPAPTGPVEPTVEEDSMILRYLEIRQTLKDYTEAQLSFAYGPVYTNAYIGTLHEELLTMESLDRWLSDPVFMAEHYSVDPETYVDRQTLLSRFTVLEDVLLGYDETTVDQLGNSDTNSDVRFCYDENGTLIRLSGGTYISFASRPHATILASQMVLGGGLEWEGLYQMDIRGNLHYTLQFNEDGTLAALVHRSNILETGLDDPNSDTYGIIKFAYDDQGRRTGAEAISGNLAPEYLTYVYGEDGSLWADNSSADIGNYMTQSFDEQGRILRETIGSIWNDQYMEDDVLEYIYGGNGKPETMIHTQYYVGSLDRVDTYTCHYDAQGRLISVSIAAGEDYDYSGIVERAPYSVEMTLIYGSYWCYSE